MSEIICLSKNGDYFLFDNKQSNHIVEQNRAYVWEEFECTIELWQALRAVSKDRRKKPAEPHPDEARQEKMELILMYLKSKHADDDSYIDIDDDPTTGAWTYYVGPLACKDRFWFYATPFYDGSPTIDLVVQNPNFTKAKQVNIIWEPDLSLTVEELANEYENLVFMNLGKLPWTAIDA